MKDLGFRVTLLDWESAMKEKKKIEMGTNQAIIYAGSGTGTKEETKLAGDLTSWTDHPLILPVLESKGLEYDDIIVAFSKKNSTWNVTSKVCSSM